MEEVYSVCLDCRDYYVGMTYNDFSSFDYYYNENAEEMINKLEDAFEAEGLQVPNVYMDPTGEVDCFSREACDICRSRLGGERHYFKILRIEE